MDRKSNIIMALCNHSDRYGFPYVVDFFEENKNIYGFKDASYQQLRSYAERHGLI